MSEAPGTRADWVDRRLREAILAGELRPGEKLVASVLARRLDVSPTPLREAFQRLAAHGLVEIEPQRGARVAPVSARDAQEIYELRLTLEPRALRESLVRADDALRDELDGCYERLAATTTDGAFALEWLDAHAAFHHALVSRCPSRWLRRFVQVLADHSQRYALVSLTGGDRRADVLAEHRGLRDAAVEGRVDDAVAGLAEHLARTLELVRAAAESDDDPAAT